MHKYDESALAAVGISWTVLRTGSQDTEGLGIPTKPTAVVTSLGPVRLALGDNGEPRVLLPLQVRELLPAFDTANALFIHTSTFTCGGKVCRFLDLTCLSRELEPVFGEVVEEMLARIMGGAGCVAAAQSTINDFRSLLMAPSGNGVDVTVVAGFVGELLVLTRLLERNPDAWLAWRGPKGDRHDFRNSNDSLEVKAVMRSGAATLRINGLEQLEAPSGGCLHLLKFVIEPVTGGVLTVSGLAHRALKMASNPVQLRELICAAGCEDIDSARWNRHSFRLDSEVLFRVEDGFPRMTSSMLADGMVSAGVSDVSYLVDLSLAEPKRVTAETYSMVMERIAK